MPRAMKPPPKAKNTGTEDKNSDDSRQNKKAIPVARESRPGASRSNDVCIPVLVKGLMYFAMIGSALWEISSG